MTIDSYLTKAFALVAEIGRVAEVNASLYIYVPENMQWTPVTSLTLSQYATRPYGFTTQGKSFAVAAAEQATMELKSVITTFKLYYFPGCCALCISSSANVYSNFRRKGINKLGLQLRQALAGAYNYKALVCTDIAQNEASIRTIEGANFTKFYSLQNKRTQNKVNLYIKELE